MRKSVSITSESGSLHGLYSLAASTIILENDTKLQLFLCQHNFGINFVTLKEV